MDFEDEESEEAPLSNLRTILHDKDLLARFVVAADRSNPQLIVVGGVHEVGRGFPLVGEMTVGRAVGVSIPIQEEGVSRRHAALRVAGDSRVLVRDIGSSNGTYVNGTRIPGEAPLQEGDLLQLGGVVFILVYLGEPKAPAAESLRSDPATGAESRAVFVSAVRNECALAGTGGDPFSVVLVAVDDAVLDGSSLAASDVGMSATLHKVVRESHGAIQEQSVTIARYRADSVALLLPDTTCEEATRFVGWLRGLESRLELAAGTSIAVGETSWQPGMSPEQLLRAAERALYLDRARLRL